MKIVLLNTLYHPYSVGGAEKSVQVLAESLSGVGVSVSVISLAPRGRGCTAQFSGVNVQYRGIPNIYWPFARRPRALKSIWHSIDSYNVVSERQVYSLLSKLKPDVLHTNNLSGFSVSAWSAAGRLGVPIVHTLRDLYLLCPRTTMYRNGSRCDSQCSDCRLMSWPRKLASAAVGHVVGISDFILQKHITVGYFPERMGEHVIPNAYCAPAGDVRVNQDESVPRKRLRIGYIGRLSPEKGPAFLLEFLRTHFPERVELLVAGEGQDDYERLLKSIWESPYVRFLGRVPPEELYSQVDIVVVPSLLEEAQGRVVFEANAHGVPVIGSNRGGIPENISEGKSGFVFDPDQPASLRLILERFVASPTLAFRMRRDCLEHARRYTPVRVAKSYEAVYQTAISRKS